MVEKDSLHEAVRVLASRARGDWQGERRHIEHMALRSALAVINDVKLPLFDILTL